MLRRKIDKYLQQWRENKEKNPLIIYGARQIGKTTSIMNFARKNYESVVAINFVEDTRFKTIFKDGYGPKEVNYNISIINPKFKFIEGKTLIFFDEVQDMIDAITCLKFYKLDGRFDVICSGSMLGVNYNRVRSISVGFKEEFQMFSLDFEEFLWAVGYTDDTIDVIYKKMLGTIPLSETEFGQFSHLFSQYIKIGGMPKIVQTFIESNTLYDILRLQGNIYIDYENDIKKYVQGLDCAKVVNYYRHITPMLARENHKFQVSQLAKGAKSRDYIGCDEWLKDAGIINIAYNVNNLSLPLKGNENSSDKRIYYAENSLLLASLDEESMEDLRMNDNFEIYNGALTESFVSEALAKSGYKELYFYKNSNSTIELDFIIRSKNQIIPIEVKTGRGRSKSLNKLLSSGLFEYGIKLANQNIGFKDGKFTFPYFLAFKLKQFLHDKISW